MMNKRLCMIIAIAGILITLTACTQVIYVHRIFLKTEYEDWVDSIGLFSNKNIKVKGYNEKEGSIEVSIEYENGLKGYKELCSVINAHNKFVDDNPDYFPNDMDICFRNEYASQKCVSFFFSNGEDALKINDYIGNLNIANSAKIKYMYIDMSTSSTELEQSDMEIDVPVVILGHAQQGSPADEDYAFLSEVKSAEQVILGWGFPVRDLDRVCKNIKTYLPDVGIYKAAGEIKD